VQNCCRPNRHGRDRGHGEDRTGSSIRKFVRTARRYRTIEIQAVDPAITVADPLPSGGAADVTPVVVRKMAQGSQQYQGHLLTGSGHSGRGGG
jgi:hypothetical protein